jgi:formylglycine-generating enzyme required for sulfatase activity
MNMKRILLAAVVWLSMGVASTLAETQSVIDPTEAIEPPKAPAAAATRPAQPDAAARRERQRAEAEQRRRAKAEARAQAAENESARLRALEQARQAEARKAAAARAAATRAAAAKATMARIAAENDAAQRQAAVREAAARELAARAATARDAAVREAAAREGAEREAKQIAAREAAARLVAAREAAAREASVKLAAARETSARETRMSKAPVRFGATFRDCADCPELVWLPQGEFTMGDASAASGPRPLVTIGYMLAVGRFEITFAEWDACVAAGGCRRRPHDAGWGRGGQPVINVSWADAQQYVTWLSRHTGKRYRLLTEAEWEYAARAGTDARYWWGNNAGRGEANCADCGSKWDGRQTAPVGRFAPNPFGLYDMHGNVSEWVEDCFHEDIRDAPGDGRAWTRDCSVATDTRIVRGGAWHASSKSMRSTSRTSAAVDYFDNRIGFRIARSE